MKNSICSKGKNQSPINIISKSTKKCNTMCNLSFFYRTSNCNLILSNKTLLIDYDTGSYITYNNEVYELDKIAFTNPSSHKIDNVSYPLEIQIYHKSSNTGKLLIIAVFIDINDAISKPKMFFDMFVDSVPKIKGEQNTVNMPEDWNIFNIIPENKSFFLYDGSIINTPCTENVTWIVYDDPINCSEKFYNKIKSVLKNNTRSLQKLNNRPIYYRDNISNKSNRNYGTQLKCYTNKELIKTCSKLTGNKDINKVNSQRIFIILIVIIILILFLLFILWLIDKGFLKKYILSFKNILNKKLINQ